MTGTGANFQSPQIFASTRNARPGNRVVVLGASIENLHSFRTSTAENFGWDWPTYAMMLSDGRFNMIQNMAIGGQTMDQFTARFATDVAPYRPNIVPTGSIENDIQLYGSQGLTNEQMVPLFAASVAALTAKCLNIGALPVFRTAMPHIATAVHTPTGYYNAWIRRYCSWMGLPLMDFWNVLVDPLTGFYQANLTPDGVHPNEEGSYRLALYWLQQMDSYLPPLQIQQPEGASDTGPLLSTPNFTTNTAGIPTGWSASGAAPTGTATRSMVADPRGNGVQLHRHQHVASTGSLSTISNAIVNTAIVSDGDVMEISGYISADGGVQATIIVSVTATASISRVPVSVIQHSLDHASYKQQFVIPAGFSRVQVTLNSSAATGTNSGTVDFSYPVLRNLTKFNAVAPVGV